MPWMVGCERRHWRLAYGGTMRCVYLLVLVYCQCTCFQFDSFEAPITRFVFPEARFGWSNCRIGSDCSCKSDPFSLLPYVVPRFGISCSHLSIFISETEVRCGPFESSSA